MTTLQDAQRLHGLGLHTMWLAPQAKSPIAKKWQEVGYLEPSAPPGAGYNLGMRTGVVPGAPVSLVAIDGDSPEALTWMAAHLPATPLKTKTSKGEHWFYRAIPGIRNKVKVGGLKLDVRADGGYVVVAPSVHPNGALYAEVEPWTQQAVAAVPAFDRAWLESPPAKARRGMLAEGERNRAMVAVAGSLRRRGLDEAAIMAGLTEENARRCAPPLDTAEITRIAHWAAQLPAAQEDGVWQQTIIRDKSGEPKPVAANVVTVLANDSRWRNVFRFSELSSEVIISREPPFDPIDMPSEAEAWRPHPASDADITRVRNWLSRHYGITVNREAAWECVTVAAMRNAFHPVREYLNGLEWDGEERVEGWLHRYFSVADTPYAKAVGKRWLVSAVARAMEPGCKADCCLVIESRQQGVGKSTALRALCPDPKWFVDTPIDLHSKDSYVTIRNAWIIEFAELDCLSRAEISRIKAFLSSCEDNYRPPYGVASVRQPRQCVFAGTVNESEYLLDTTGNRRFWPVTVTEYVDVAGVEAMRDQLWAEAVYLYRQGERHHLTYDESLLAGGEQAERQIADPWTAPIYDYLRAKVALAERGVSAQEILCEVIGLHLDAQDRWKLHRVNSILCSMGFVQRRAGGKGGRRYYPGGEQSPLTEEQQRVMVFVGQESVF